MTNDPFQQYCVSEGLPCPEKEYRFHDTRKWRFDYAFIEHKIALEVEGGIWTQGRHTRGSGFLKDMDKYNTATMLGWRILRTTPDMILTLATIEMIRYCINNNPS